MNKISAKIIADSIGPMNNRITTLLVTFPRFILSELNTHRMFSKNSASSRAIPFNKMVKMCIEDPFIPIAWQKDHSGMQGNEYLDPNQKFGVSDFLESLKTLSNKIDTTLYHKIIGKYSDLLMTLPEWWLFTRDKVIEASILLNMFGVTKQLCNRLLEPFMWHTVLVTATEFSNFFDLRCPKYEIYAGPEDTEEYLCSGKSWKDLMKSNNGLAGDFDTNDIVERLKYSKSGAEIHIQALAEAMWDAQNESIPKQLETGEWHIPFGDSIDIEKLANLNPNGKDIIKVATARCARLSYMTFDGEINYEKDISLHNQLLESKHYSPFEHCARVMTDEEYNGFVKGYREQDKGFDWLKQSSLGWCNNFKGFIQYRYLIEKC